MSPSLALPSGTYVSSVSDMLTNSPTDVLSPDVPTSSVPISSLASISESTVSTSPAQLT